MLGEVGLVFHEEGRLSGLAGDFKEALGVAALAAADHDHGVDGLRQPLHFRLPPLGGIADGFEHLVVRVALGRPLLDGIEEPGVLGGLGDDDGLVESRQPCQFLDAGHHVAVGAA